MKHVGGKGPAHKPKEGKKGGFSGNGGETGRRGAEEK